MHNFTLSNCDTDSVMICNQDMSEMTKEFRQQLLDEINSKFPELIKYADDGYFEKCIIVRAKNYILFDGQKIKIKGSSLKATTRSPALKELLGKFIDTMIKIDDIQVMNRTLQNIYNSYMLEIHNGITDIKRWSVRKTLSSTMEESERANETKVIAALKGSNYREGDRFFCFYLPDDTICLAENFKGEYNKKRLFKNIYDTISIFDTVIPVKELFINYELKRNQKHLPGYVEVIPVRKPVKSKKNKDVQTDVSI